MGVPFMRPIWFEFPDDPVTMTADVEDSQFMAGSSYLVAPVTKSGDRSKKVYLPSGARWKHYFTNEEYRAPCSHEIIKRWWKMDNSSCTFGHTSSIFEDE